MPTQTEGTHYVPVTCKSSKTLALARDLYVEHGVQAWTPRTVNRNPKKGEKRVKPALPGFVFIPIERIDEAKALSAKMLVPQFTTIVFALRDGYCTIEELLDFDQALKDSRIPEELCEKGLEVGDYVLVKHGLLAGFEGEVKGLYIENCLMARLNSGIPGTPDIRLPAAYLS